MWLPQATCASTASVWGSQKVMSMARYIARAVVSAVRASSRWPTQDDDLHQPLHQPQGVGRQQDASRGGELFHAGREMRRLAYGRVIHV
jgi:hypothetical protein